MSYDSILLHASEMTRQPDGRIFRVKFSRSVVIPDGEGGNTTSVVGEIRDVHEAIAAAIDDAGTILGVVKNGQLQPSHVRPDPTAGIVPAREVPASFQKLPACFAEWYRLGEVWRVLAERQNCWEKAATRILSENFASNLKKSEAAREERRQFPFVKCGRSQFECSRIVIKAIEAANGVRDELEKLARAAFALRLAPLGLSDGQVGRLFFGSALYIKFVRPDLPVHDMRQAYYDARMCHYIDAPVTAQAHTLERADAYRAELEKLLIEAKVELANAHKFSKAA